MVLENIDYKKISERKLRDLINEGDDDAVYELVRRREAGEIPSQVLPIDALLENQNKKKKAS